MRIYILGLALATICFGCSPKMGYTRKTTELPKYGEFFVTEISTREYIQNMPGGDFIIIRDRKKAMDINFGKIRLKSKRLGSYTYDLTGNVKEMWVPVFAQTSERDSILK